MEELISGLAAKDQNYAYRCLNRLKTISDETNTVYPYWPLFHEMMGDVNTYVKIRGMELIIANAKWDHERKIDVALKDILAHIRDLKPIAARSCIRLLPRLVTAKPYLREQVQEALLNVDLRIYGDNMAPLIKKDIGKALLSLAEGL